MLVTYSTSIIFFCQFGTFPKILFPFLLLKNSVRCLIMCVQLNNSLVTNDQAFLTALKILQFCFFEVSCKRKGCVFLRGTECGKRDNQRASLRDQTKIKNRSPVIRNCIKGLISTPPAAAAVHETAAVHQEICVLRLIHCGNLCNVARPLRRRILLRHCSRREPCSLHLLPTG